MKKRRLWKTYYMKSHGEANSLQSCWQSYGDKKVHHRMEFVAGFVETNLPLADIRRLFEWADVRSVRWDDYVSDVKPSWEEES